MVSRCNSNLYKPLVQLPFSCKLPFQNFFLQFKFELYHAYICSIHIVKVVVSFSKHGVDREARGIAVNIATAWVLSYPTVGGGAAMGDLGKPTMILEGGTTMGAGEGVSREPALQLSAALDFVRVGSSFPIESFRPAFVPNQFPFRCSQALAFWFGYPDGSHTSSSPSDHIFQTCLRLCLSLQRVHF
jgi:hypothetical protein